jgi:hypothetical protein
MVEGTREELKFRSKLLLQLPQGACTKMPHFLPAERLALRFPFAAGTACRAPPGENSKEPVPLNHPGRKRRAGLISGLRRSPSDSRIRRCPSCPRVNRPPLRLERAGATNGYRPISLTPPTPAPTKNPQGRASARAEIPGRGWRGPPSPDKSAAPSPTTPLPPAP